MAEQIELVKENFLIEWRVNQNKHTANIAERLRFHLPFATASSATLIRKASLPHRPHGIDISRWQGSYTPTENPPKPVDFVIVKFSEGYAQDSLADVMWEGAKQAKRKEGYHYWRTGASLQQQIDSFLRTADGKDVDAAWLDWEGYNNSLNSYQYKLAYEWIQEMRKHFPKVGLYTNRNHYEQMNGYAKYSVAWHTEVPFWYASYWNPVPDPFTADPTLPKGCKNWDTWQYGICQYYGNKDNGRDYGVQSASLDVNIRNPEFYQPTPNDCDKLKQEYIKLQEKYALLEQENNEMFDDLMDILEIAQKYQ